MPLIVIDPRRTELARLADLHLQLHPGTNVALLNGMGHVIAKEHLTDAVFVRDRTEGFDDWLALVEDCTPEVTSNATGVPVHLITEAARRYARSGGSMAVHGVGHDRTSLGQPRGDGPGGPGVRDREHRKPGTGSIRCAGKTMYRAHRMSVVYRPSLPGISR